MTRSRCCRPEVMRVSRCPVDPVTLSCRSRAAAMMVLVLLLVPACSIGTAQEADDSPPCNSRRMAVVTEFARQAGRVSDSHYGEASEGESPGCHVDLLVPRKGLDSDAMRIIDEAVAPLGWKREGEARWVNPDGFEVTARDDSGPGEVAEDFEEEPSMADHEVYLYGTAAK